MANTFEDYTVSTSTTDFNITFEYLEDSHVVVEIDLLHGARRRQPPVPGQELPDGADRDLDVPDPLPA